jgi:hypothetical protein
MQGIGFTDEIDVDELGHAPQGAVGLAVAAAVQPVPGWASSPPAAWRAAGGGCRPATAATPRGTLPAVPHKQERAPAREARWPLRATRPEAMKAHGR